MLPEFNRAFSLAELRKYKLISLDLSLESVKTEKIIITTTTKTDIIFILS